MCIMIWDECIYMIWLVGRAAATEIGVLHDVLAVAREKRYLVLDPVNNDMPDQRNLPVLLMLARKRVHFTLNVIILIL